MAIAATPKVPVQCYTADELYLFNLGRGWVAVVTAADTKKALKAGAGTRETGLIAKQHGVRITVE